ncbi:MAG: beta-galactosidase, partial [Bacteroidales bacterium]|nr:beta-galactosidase [Bacteroidales bacterium]
MKKLFLLVILFIGVNTFGSSLPEYKDINVVQVNRLEPHASNVIFESHEKALVGTIEDSKYYQSLNGKWKFNWSVNPESRPADFYKTDFDVSAWKEIDVPGNWELQGYDYAIYRNHPFDFTLTPRPPHIPDHWNPVGSYRTSFTVNDDLKNQRIVI